MTSSSPEPRSPRLVLASASPRRSDLLRTLGLPFDVVPSAFDEEAIETHDPETFARLAARGKCLDVARRLDTDAVTIGSDTVVCYQDAPDMWRILGKPRDADDARAMLRALSGRMHRVITAVAVSPPSREPVVRADAADVQFRELSEHRIDEYVRTGEPLDKAGAYGIQGGGGRLVESVRGDMNTVVGFPLALVAEMLRAWYDRLPAVSPAAFEPSRGGCPSHTKRPRP